MDKELTKYYESLFEMFQSDGWKYFVEDMDRDLQSVNSILLDYADTSTGVDNVWHYRGKRSVLKNIVAFKENAEDAYEQLLKGSDTDVDV